MRLHRPSVTLIGCLACVLSSSISAAEVPRPAGDGNDTAAAAKSATASAGPVKHRFACSDYTGGKVFVVGTDGKVEWEYPAERVHDIWVLPNGNVLFTTAGKGVFEVTREKKVVFEAHVGETYACQRLPNGNTFIGVAGPKSLVEVDPNGKIVKRFPLELGGHGGLRIARVLANGNYLCAHLVCDTVREYDPLGKMIRDIPVVGGPTSAIRLANGNTLISLSDRKDGSRVIEVDPEGKTVWEITNADLPGGMKFMCTCGLHRLPNGNTVISNWLGHGGKPPHLIEVTPDKKVVWTFSGNEKIKTIMSVQILDEPQDCLKGEVIH